MLSFERKGAGGPSILFLHWLGGGAQTWREVMDGLAGRGVQCVAVDLPGFGESASAAGYGIAAMTDAVADTVRALRSQKGLFADGEPWLLAGHSMGGTVATLLARRALDGEAGLEGLRGLLLVSPSPPGPEPMPDSKREDLLKSLGESTGNPDRDRKNAESFVTDNVGKLPLPEAVQDRAVEGVLGMNRGAFRMWLEHGSREDWRTTIGKLVLPALVFAGTEDGALGPDAQREDTMPALPEGKLVTLEAAGHLAPLERPGELVEYITEFLAGLDLPLKTPVAQPGSPVEGLVHSDRTSPKTLEVMTDRLNRAQDWDHHPRVFSAADFRTLRALAETVVPDAGFDLAALIDAQLDAQRGGELGDGWRFATLPSDPDAWRRGLASLDYAAQQAHGVAFLALDPERRHKLWQQAGDGELGKGLLGTLHLGGGAEVYAAQAMKQWAEDARAELTRLYVGDPRTMDRLRYTGFADEFGFTQIQLGQAETSGPAA